MCLDLYVVQKPWKGLLYMMCILMHVHLLLSNFEWLKC